MFKKLAHGVAAICVLGALAAQPAAASVIFKSTTEPFGMNFNVSADSVHVVYSTSFSGKAIGPSGGAHPEVFTVLDGAGANVFSGALDQPWRTDFADADMLDGTFSAVVSFTDAQLPVMGPPGALPALQPNLMARGRDIAVGGTSYRSDVSTFEPAATSGNNAPEPLTLALVVAALSAVCWVRRGLRARA